MRGYFQMSKRFFSWDKPKLFSAWKSCTKVILRFVDNRFNKFLTLSHWTNITESFVNWRAKIEIFFVFSISRMTSTMEYNSESLLIYLSQIPIWLRRTEKKNFLFFAHKIHWWFFSFWIWKIVKQYFSVLQTFYFFLFQTHVIKSQATVNRQEYVVLDLYRLNSMLTWKMCQENFSEGENFLRGGACAIFVLRFFGLF